MAYFFISPEQTEVRKNALLLWTVPVLLIVPLTRLASLCDCFSVFFLFPGQETLAKFKRLLSLARRSIEENQRQITEKDAKISVLREALATAENARRR